LSKRYYFDKMFSSLLQGESIKDPVSGDIIQYAITDVTTTGSSQYTANALYTISVPNTTATNVGGSSNLVSSWNTNLVSPTVSEYSSSSTFSQYTVTQPGVYLFSVAGTWASNTIGVRTLFIEYNGNINQQIGSSALGTNSLGTTSSHSCTAVQYMNANDYVVIGAYQNSGAALSLTAKILCTCLSQ